MNPRRPRKHLTSVKRGMPLDQYWWLGLEDTPFQIQIVRTRLVVVMAPCRNGGSFEEHHAATGVVAVASLLT